MKMYRRIKYSIIASIVAIVIGGAIYINSLLPIVTGYAAKNLASAVFVSHRSQEDVEALDLNFSLIKYATNKIDYEKKIVTSKFLWDKSVAIYREGYGCTLVDDLNDVRWDLPRVAAAYNPDTVAWPLGNLLPELETGADIDRLTEIKHKLIDRGEYGGYAFAFVVLHKGVPVMEGYNKGIDRDTKLLSWSIAKSFTNALAGIMTHKEMLDIYAPTNIEEWEDEDDARKQISVDDLLRMQSGLKWNEGYGNRSDVTVMLHCEDDFGEYASEKRLRYTPGKRWEYSSGSTNIVNMIMRSKFDNDDDYYRFSSEQLFSKIGMANAVFELDASGTQVGSSYIYATARDYARFALLYLNDGYFDGEQILPNDWVDYTTHITSDSNGEYGASFWLNLSKTLPSVPTSMYSCNGHDGQRIFILPDEDLAVVVLGYSPKESNNMDFDALVADVVSAVK